VQAVVENEFGVYLASQNILGP